MTPRLGSVSEGATSPVRVAVLTIGDELLQGHVVDTNFTRLATWFTERGHAVGFHASVGDDADAIAALLLETLDRADLVAVTGGLGPTPDDVTVHAVARVLGRRVVTSAEVIERLEAQYRAAGREMPPLTRKTAEIVESAELVENPVGQAPCQWIPARGDRVVVLLPGVPSELEAILAESLGARVPSAAGAGYRTFRTIGIAESRLAQELVERGVTGIAYLPWAGGVDVRMRATPASDEIAAVLAQVAGDALLGEARRRASPRAAGEPRRG
jgi:nicotinamide-nucleotide amidase